MKKKIDEKTKVFLSIFAKMGVKFVDEETGEDLLDDSDNNGTKQD